VKPIALAGPGGDFRWRRFAVRAAFVALLVRLAVVTFVYPDFLQRWMPAEPTAELPQVYLYLIAGFLVTLAAYALAPAREAASKNEAEYAEDNGVFATS
jgi:hypothetical protein